MAKDLIELCVRLWASNGLSRRAMLEPAREPSIVGLQDYEDLCVLSLASLSLHLANSGEAPLCIVNGLQGI